MTSQLFIFKYNVWVMFEGDIFTIFFKGKASKDDLKGTGCIASTTTQVQNSPLLTGLIDPEAETTQWFNIHV